MKSEKYILTTSLDYIDIFLSYIEGESNGIPFLGGFAHGSIGSGNFDEQYILIKCDEDLTPIKGILSEEIEEIEGTYCMFGGIRYYEYDQNKREFKFIEPDNDKFKDKYNIDKQVFENLSILRNDFNNWTDYDDRSDLFYINENKKKLMTIKMGKYQYMSDDFDWDIAGWFPQVWTLRFQIG